MTNLRLFNTYSGTKEDFSPIVKGRVGMYHCGPTVYNYAHIGNLRAYVFADTIRRAFEYAGYKVLQVINITDVGHLTSEADTGKDKVEERAKREGKTAAEIADVYAKAFFDDLKRLNVWTKGTVFPKATENIPEQIELIKTLEQKGFVYKTSDGMYFDTGRFSEYGRLGNIDIAGLSEGARVEINSEKHRPTDFALWKFSQPNERRLQEWNSPWGVGFPGWHVECSAMSEKYLGQPFDIHTGGIEHIPVHHNNEIAQSVCAHGKPLANYWMHVSHAMKDGAKMSKSTGNFLTLTALTEHAITPLAYRYWLLTSHYRSPINFTIEAVQNAQNAYERIKNALMKTEGGESKPSISYLETFEGRIYDDFDTSQAIGVMWKLMRDKTVDARAKKATVREMDKILGLELLIAPKKSSRLPAKIAKLAEKREAARAAKDFANSDKLRSEIEKFGYSVKDTPDGQEIEKHK